MPPQVELFRIVATVGQAQWDDAAEPVVGRILEWARDGLEKPFPAGASRMQPFKHYEKGASVVVARIAEPQRDVWAIRLDRADGSASNCMRGTEVAFERIGDKPIKLTVRELVDRDRRIESIPPAAPAFLGRIDAEIGLYNGWERFESEPWIIGSEEDCQRLKDLMIDPERVLPLVVLTVPQEAADGRVPLIDPRPVAAAMAGMAKVAVLPHSFTWDLTNRFGKELSVYLGAARIYLPGFDDSTDPYAHELFLLQRCGSSEERNAMTAKLLRAVAKESVERYQLGRDLFEFKVIRSEANGDPRRSELATEPSPSSAVEEPASVSQPEPPPTVPEEVEEVAAEAPAATDPPDAGEQTQEREDLGRGANLAETPASGTPILGPMRIHRGATAPDLHEIGTPSWGLHVAAEFDSSDVPPKGLFGRVRAFFRRLFGVREHFCPVLVELSHVKEQLKSLSTKLEERDKESQWLSDEHAKAEERANKAEAELAKASPHIKELEERLAELQGELRNRLPRSWSDFPRWYEETLVDSVILMSQPAREIKKAKFKDVELAAKALQWLGEDYRVRRLEGGNGDLRGKIPGLEELQNEPSGGDSFSVNYGGQQTDVKWHIKNGGNARDPARCLRIYYFWDQTNEQVVVASMPAHYRVTGR